MLLFIYSLRQHKLDFCRLYVKTLCKLFILISKYLTFIYKFKNVQYKKRKTENPHQQIYLFTDIFHIKYQKSASEYRLSFYFYFF